MKVAAISGAVIAALAATAVATPSFAQSYGYARDSGCRSDGTAGTVIGGIAGALLGSSLAAHHGGRAGGAAIGGVAGALIGNSVARKSCGDRGYSSRYSSTRDYSSGYYSQPSYGYAQPNYGYAQPSYSYAQPSYRSYGYAQPRYGAYGGGYDNRYSDNGYRDYRERGDERRGHHHDHDNDWDGD